jgi:hypothetical protein
MSFLFVFQAKALLDLKENENVRVCNQTNQAEHNSNTNAGFKIERATDVVKCLFAANFSKPVVTRNTVTTMFVRGLDISRTTTGPKECPCGCGSNNTKCQFTDSTWIKCTGSRWMKWSDFSSFLKTQDTVTVEVQMKKLGISPSSIPSPVSATTIPEVYAAIPIAPVNYTTLPSFELQQLYAKITDLESNLAKQRQFSQTVHTLATDFRNQIVTLQTENKNLRRQLLVQEPCSKKTSLKRKHDTTSTSSSSSFSFPSFPSSPSSSSSFSSTSLSTNKRQRVVIDVEKDDFLALFSSPLPSDIMPKLEQP